MQSQVFVPDAPSTTPQRDSVGTAEDVEMLRSSASASVATPPANGAGADGDNIPEWWNPSPALHVSLYYKQEVCRSPSTCCLRRYHHLLHSALLPGNGLASP